MIKLKNNPFNKGLRRDEQKLRIWRYAGLMLTYKCSASCQFCYYNCGPESGGLMPIETVLKTWKGLVDLVGPDASVHITGGEPFLYFDHMMEAVWAAKNVGLSGFDSVETNASWAVDREIIVKRMELLDEAGMGHIKISCDPFHAEFVPVERVRRLVEVAGEVLGEERVVVLWEKYLDSDICFSGMGESEKLEVFREAMGSEYCRLTGRAAGKLADMVADQKAEEFKGGNCRSGFLATQGVHVDPNGNVFSGLCSGIVVGNVNNRSLYDIWREFDPSTMEFVEKLLKESSYGLLAEAVELGYEVRQGYGGKCHLCTDLRQFFFDKGKFPAIIGPCDCYV